MNLGIIPLQTYRIKINITWIQPLDSYGFVLRCLYDLFISFGHLDFQ